MKRANSGLMQVGFLTIRGVELAFSVRNYPPKSKPEACERLFYFVPKRLAFCLVPRLSWVRDEWDNQGSSVHGLVLGCS